MSKTYVGIMVNPTVYRNIPTGKTGHEKLLFYEEACRELGLVPCFFRLQDIRLSSGTVTAYVRGRLGYKRKVLPLPRVIHNRAIHTRKKPKNKLFQLTRHGITLFNTLNRYSKMMIHELLMQSTALRPHLPGSELATAENLPHYMTQYDELILKPDNSSVGRGIMMIRRDGDAWSWIMSSRRGSRVRAIATPEKLPARLVEKITKTRYVVQQRLPLATYRGRPFDLRVSVQKDGRGDWQITGIAGKFAARGKFVTNVAQGGSVQTLDVLLSDYPHLQAEEIRDNVGRFSLDVAAALEPHLAGLADIGLDIGITEHGYPLFIECNCRDLRYSFKEGGMLEAWRATYDNPMKYARHLIDQAVVERMNTETFSPVLTT